MGSGSGYWVSGVAGQGGSLTVAGLDSRALQTNMKKPEKLSDLSEAIQMGSGRGGVRQTRAKPALPFGALETSCHGKKETETRRERERERERRGGESGREGERGQSRRKQVKGMA